MYAPQADREIAVIAQSLTPYPNMGRRIFQEMDRKLTGLKDNPFAWPVYHANPMYRRMNIEGHSIFYIVDEDKHEVLICHIYYNRRDIPNFIDE
jgi:plasmid stabilization system protein ParE